MHATRLSLVSLLLTAGCAGAGPTAPSAGAPAESAPVAADASASPATTAQTRGELLPELAEHVQQRLQGLEEIDPERREALDRLAAWIAERRDTSTPVRLLFICTHNSRRSHMGQLWAATAATYFGIDAVATFSGGTEATAFNPRAVASLQRAGFRIAAQDEGDNPRYEVSYSPSHPALAAWSKVYDDDANPHDGFAAVMTCSAADEACPFVRGADMRIAIPYEDPKAADGTPAEAATYDERSAQIATEMLYVFSRVAGGRGPG